MSTGLFIRKETPKGRVLEWYGEPIGRIYRDPTWKGQNPKWLGEYWNGVAKAHVWEPRTEPHEAAVAVLGKWAQDCRVDLGDARYS